MRTMILWVAVALGLYELSQFAMELPGNPSAPPPKRADLPWTLADLRAEIPNLPESVYTVFATAVYYQVSAEDDLALEEYEKLRNIPRKGGGKFDLSTVSNTLKHNLSLLRQHKSK